MTSYGRCWSAGLPAVLRDGELRLESFVVKLKMCVDCRMSLRTLGVFKLSEQQPYPHPIMKTHHHRTLHGLWVVSFTVPLMLMAGLPTAYAQGDVTQPGDPIIASSSNSPGSEGVANAIDNTQAKYLNRDLANDAKPAGFAVTPA